MRVLLEGFKLARARDSGGVDSYWRSLVPALLRAAPPDIRFTVLSAFLNPARVRMLAPHGRAGAAIRHWWAAPEWLERIGRWGVRASWLGGPHDVAHAVEPSWPYPGPERVVVTLHDLMYLHHPQYLDPRWAARLLSGTRDLARRATYWICVSAHTRDDLVRELGVPRARTCVVPHGVDDRFRTAAANPARVAAVRQAAGLDRRPYFLFVGSVEPKKNLGVLLRAYALAMGRGLAADLAVAGRAGWNAESVRAAAATSALRERVRFLGFVEEADLPFLVAGAMAAVLPSRYEGFGMPVLEAMAAGTPVLCSDRGALPEIAGGAARHFDADDVEGLAGLLVAIDGDPHLRDNLRQAGLERARDFSWERCARQTIAAYRRALELPA